MFLFFFKIKLISKNFFVKKKFHIYKILKQSYAAKLTA